MQIGVASLICCSRCFSFALRDRNSLLLIFISSRVSIICLVPTSLLLLFLFLPLLHIAPFQLFCPVQTHSSTDYSITTKFPLATPLQPYVLYWPQPINNECCGWTSPSGFYDCKTSFSNNFKETLKRYRFIIYKTLKLHSIPGRHREVLGKERESESRDQGFSFYQGSGWESEGYSLLVNLKHNNQNLKPQKGPRVQLLLGFRVGVRDLLFIDEFKT